MPVVRCPQCNSQMMVEPPDAGHEVECPACMAAFVAPKAPTPLATDERPPLRRREELPSSHYEHDDDDRPRRSRKRRSRSITTEDLEDAKAAVKIPAKGLLLTGWIGLAFHLIGGVAAFVIGMIMIAQPNLNKKAEENAILLMVFGGLVALISIPYCIPIAIGGHKLVRIETLQSTIWVYVAAIMGVCTVMFCGLFSPFTWFASGFGLWAIIALNNSDVKRVIEANAQNDRE